MTQYVVKTKQPQYLSGYYDEDLSKECTIKSGIFAKSSDGGSCEWIITNGPPKNKNYIFSCEYDNETKFYDVIFWENKYVYTTKEFEIIWHFVKDNNLRMVDTVSTNSKIILIKDNITFPKFNDEHDIEELNNSDIEYDWEVHVGII